MVKHISWVATNVEFSTEVFGFLRGDTALQDIPSGPVDMLSLLVENGTDPSSILHANLYNVCDTRYYMQCIEYVTRQDHFVVDVNEVGSSMVPPVHAYVMGHIAQRA